MSEGVGLDGVRAAYEGVEVLAGLDLTVAAGEYLTVLGPSGAGKSTLLRVIAGLEPATGGRVRIGGRDVTGLRPGRRDVAMVFQSYALFPHLSVADNIAFGLLVKDVPKREAAARARAAAEIAGCADLLARRPGKLSGGERQRVALARALVREPAVFLFDEPLSNLDAELRERTRAELRAVHERVGGTVVHVTHDQVEALSLGDRVAVLAGGRLEQVGTPDELWLRPANRFVARFVGSPPMNLLPADHALVGALAVPGVEFGVRPEAVRLAGIADTDAVPAIVERVEVVGADAYLHLHPQENPRVGVSVRASRGLGANTSVDAADPERAPDPPDGRDGHLTGTPTAVLARVPSRGRPAAGNRVQLTVDPGDWHRFDVTTGLRR